MRRSLRCAKFSSATPHPPTARGKSDRPLSGRVTLPRSGRAIWQLGVFENPHRFPGDSSRAHLSGPRFTSSVWFENVGQTHLQPQHNFWSVNSLSNNGCMATVPFAVTSLQNLSCHNAKKRREQTEGPNGLWAASTSRGSAVNVYAALTATDAQPMRTHKLKLTTLLWPLMRTM